ncbi:MAG: ABC transporter ATP-binding protein [Chloroflexi bacterium]|nr:ABC transporter ATP-binding protein [Chloroflexota bacterium]MBV6436050.1 Spermidine/putrescine import ATP-binding protein PotA [Anaerolineae bacterium]MDL1917076.1 ABC transporter ATP-binding protein [Anaerolineae bacterium CFX4]OQY86639.1 MAG: spermidine/putrescine ABC transporter ATP-binding protein [Anaerolineae bacterium UTCFX5]MBW7878673.1 ABC transporter ATP-binding protein [Anaerolineae bacterium]
MSAASRTDAEAAVVLKGVSKHFGGVKALDYIDLEIYDGEFFSMLGPSGSGKTTSLRIVAGFEQPTAGRVMLYGRDVTTTPPFDRDVNTVFQDYALFPHMTVEQNVGYGLMIRKVNRHEIQRRVGEMLEMVRLPGTQARRPSQLSGGQRQRIALARALINRPRVLLLDEPLGALDLKLRQQMQIELKAIQREVGITFIFVTHDQEEALTMSDRLAVFNHGRIEQIGAPADVYERPLTAFVAGFVGTTNILTDDIAQRLVGRPAALSIRPEKIRLLPQGTIPDPDQFAASGTVRDVIYVGMTTRFIVALDGGGELEVVSQNLDTRAEEAFAARGTPMVAVWHKSAMRELSTAGA